MSDAMLPRKKSDAEAQRTQRFAENMAGTTSVILNEVKDLRGWLFHGTTTCTLEIPQSRPDFVGDNRSFGVTNITR